MKQTPIPYPITNITTGQGDPLGPVAKECWIGRTDRRLLADAARGASAKIFSGIKRMRHTPRIANLRRANAAYAGRR